MGNVTQCQPPCAEEYPSEDTQGHDDADYVQNSGGSLPLVQAHRHLGAMETVTRIGRRILREGKRITEAQLNEMLEQHNIPGPNQLVEMYPVIREGEFSYISELLGAFGQGEWASLPRTFCILRMLGCIDLMDSFVEIKRDDTFLPYDDRNLPEMIKGAELRAKFLSLQPLVMSFRLLPELEHENGKHFYLPSPTDALRQFQRKRVLGVGNTAEVAHVCGISTKEDFALKRIHRGMSALRDQEALIKFTKELKTLKAASHRHLVKLISSFTDPETVGLVMQPVADENLKVYLRRIPDSAADQDVRKQCIRTFFGCLVMALEYLHKRRIVHKDIKPQNVLVKGTEVFLTDFGTSRVIGDLSRSLSTGISDGFTRTPRYCAQEVEDRDLHGMPSDIWSMGCVFIEMATVLNDRTLDELEDYYDSHGENSLVFWQNQEATKEWARYLRSGASVDDATPLDWAATMMQDSQKDRPSAGQVLAKIADIESDHRFFCLQCLDEGRHGNTTNHNPVGEVESEVLSDSGLLPPHDRDDEDTATSTMLEDGSKMDISPQQEAGPTEKSEILGTSMPDVPVLASGNVDPDPESNKDAQSHCSTESGCLSCSESQETLGSETEPAHPVKEPSHAGMDALEGNKRTRKHVQFKVDGVQPVVIDDTVQIRPERFVGLEQDRRPIAYSPSEDPVNFDDMAIEPPDPLKPPPVDRKACYPLPKSTLVPSYILAGSNHFSLSEIRASDPVMGDFNLFVYGRLMFPSVLRGFAARSTRGQYSPMHQRRLIPSSTDWAGVDASVKRAAESMVPACLKDFDVWRPSGMQCAAIQEKCYTQDILQNRKHRGLPPLEAVPPGEVTGFLVLGVTEEALRCCDLVFSSSIKSLKTAAKDVDEQSYFESDEPLLRRRMVVVETQLTSGEYRSVSAFTYVWSQYADHLRHAWRPEDFIRCHLFQDLSLSQSQDDSVSLNWRAEEAALAETMKIAYALIGDELCSAIAADNASKLQELLDDGSDPDASCRKFGSPLQAAVAYGRDEMVRILLQKGANPSMKGGKYGTPLIAATIGSKKNITRMLLKSRANVFASDAQYVNALYQAVGKKDWAITKMLLEAGAWLSHDYMEIADLAVEIRDSELQSLLLEYDVRETFVQRRDRDTSDWERGGIGHSEDQSVVKVSSSRVLRRVLRKFIILNTKSGSWRGRKGLELTRTALRAGAPPIILDYIRDAINPIQKLIDVLKAADSKHEEERRRMIEEGWIEELDTEEDDVEDTEQSEIESGYEYIVAPSPQLTPSSPLSRASSTSPVSSDYHHYRHGSRLPRRLESGKIKRDSAHSHVPLLRDDDSTRPPPPSQNSPDFLGLAHPAQKGASRKTLEAPLLGAVSTYHGQVPRLVIPKTEPASNWRADIPRRPIAPHYIIPEPHLSESPISPLHLAPPTIRRGRAHTIDNESSRSFSPPPQADSGAETSQYLSPGPQSSQIRRWNSERSSRDPCGNIPCYDQNGLRRRAGTSRFVLCEPCNGMGYYRVRARGDLARDVTCTNCRGSGHVPVYRQTIAAY